MAASEPEAAILRYLIRHPRAKDTADGVARWWLGPAGASFTVDEVRDALGRLAAEGWVASREGSDRPPLWELSAERRAQIEGESGG